LAFKLIRGGTYGSSDVDGSKLQQPAITMQNFVAIGRRVSENEDLILK